MKLNALIFAVLAASSTAMADTSFEVPVGCKNLALMAAELLGKSADSGSFSEQPSNPSKITLNAKKSGLIVTKTEFLGGDSDESGKLPCSKNASLCTNPAGAGGSIDWARLTIADKASAYVEAEVIVSMGSRGGCTLSSAKVPANN